MSLTHPPLSASPVVAMRYDSSMGLSLSLSPSLPMSARVQCYNPIVKRQAQSQGSAKRRGAKGEKRRGEEKTGHKMATEQSRVGKERM